MARRMTAGALKESCKMGKAAAELIEILQKRHPKSMTLAVANIQFDQFRGELEDDTKAAVANEAAAADAPSKSEAEV